MNNIIDDYTKRLTEDKRLKIAMDENEIERFKQERIILQEEQRIRREKEEELRREKEAQAKFQAQEQARKRAEQDRQYMIKHRYQYIDEYHKQYKEELITLKNNFNNNPELLNKLVKEESEKLTNKIDSLPIHNYNPEHGNWDFLEAVNRHNIEKSVFNKK